MTRICNKHRDWPLSPEQLPPAGACFVRLTRGYVAWLDPVDFARFGHLNWHAIVSCGNPYAARRVFSGGKSIGYSYMHREILAAGPQEQIDHREHYPLLKVVDNRRSNLRSCTQSQNNANGARRRNPGQHSPFIGVTRGRWGKGWVARVKGPTGWPQYAQTFREEWHAALARDLEAYKRYGDFARLNFDIPKPGEPRFLEPAAPPARISANVMGDP